MILAGSCEGPEASADKSDDDAPAYQLAGQEAGRWSVMPDSSVLAACSAEERLGFDHRDRNAPGSAGHFEMRGLAGSRRRLRTGHWSVHQ
jgi:hypothetical protein